MINNLNYKKITYDLLSLALPMMVTQIIAVGSGFLSIMMLSGLGNTVLAASALIFSTRIAILITCSSILFALSILIGHAYGEKKYRRIGNFMQQGWLFALFISIPVMIIFWKIDFILLYFGQSKSLIPIVQSFFHANIWNVLPFMLSVCNQQLCYGTRKQKIDLIGNFLSVFLLLISSYILIFGKIGFPSLGVSGLGYALDLQVWCYFLFTSFVIFINPFFKPFKLFSYRIHEKWDDFVSMVKIGWPIALQIGGEMLSFFVSTAMVGWLGTLSLAAYQIVTQYFILIIVPLFALSQAGSVLIGLAKGEKNESKIKLINDVAIRLALIITFIVAILFLALPKYLTSFYLDVDNPLNHETVHLVILLFAVCAIQQIFDAIRNVLTGSLRGLFDTRFPMIVGLSAIWLISLPIGYLLAFCFNYGVVGIALGTSIGLFIGMVLLFYRWKHLTSKLNLD